MKKRHFIFLIGFLALIGTGVFFSKNIHADIMASGDDIQLENWIMVDGGPLMQGNVLFNIHRATFGQPLSGAMLANPLIINEIPTFDNKLLTGFLFVNFFELVSPDDQYDIEYVQAFEYAGGPEIQEVTWTSDEDPYFRWGIKVDTLPVEGYSVEFDALPDKFVDTLDPFYQTPDFFLVEGPHIFYVAAKNTDGAFGNVGSFEIWVDPTDPEITDILPADSAIVNDPMPAIQATFFDALSGLNVDTLTMEIDSTPVPATFDPDTGILSYTPGTSLGDGLVTIGIGGEDYAGNVAIPVLWSFTIDTQSPSGTILISNGAPSTATNIVSLQISAVELETAMDMMIISNDGVFDSENWEPYAASRDNWKLTETAGIKTVYIMFRDIAGNESEIYSDSIILTVASPNTYVISGPSSITEEADVTFTFTSTEPGAQFSYKLDSGDWTALDPATTAEFTDLGVGNHYFQVRAGFDIDGSGEIDADEIDATPALVSWTIGTLSPSTLFAERPVKYYRRE